MAKIVRLTESDLVRLVKRVIKEQEQIPSPSQNPNTLMVNEQSWSDIWDTAKGAIFGPLAYSSPSTLKRGIFGILGTQTGESIFKSILSTTPVGVLKNMALSAARGDANSFSQAWQQAEKTAKTDISSIKDAAFKDMKSFGTVLQKMGIK